MLQKRISGFVTLKPQIRATSGFRQCYKQRYKCYQDIVGVEFCTTIYSVPIPYAPALGWTASVAGSVTSSVTSVTRHLKAASHAAFCCNYLRYQYIVVASLASPICSGCLSCDSNSVTSSVTSATKCPEAASHAAFRCNYSRYKRRYQHIVVGNFVPQHIVG